jgi:hypothetical protein
MMAPAAMTAALSSALPAGGRFRPATANARAIAAISAIAAALGLLIAVAGTRSTAPEVSPWPRFWATAYFIVLLWPAGLALVGWLAGVRAQAAAGLLLALLTVGQQLGQGSMGPPALVRWSTTLAAPGDAIRQRIALPARGDRAWESAWRRASRAAVSICTWEAVAPEAGVMVILNGGPPVPLHALPRGGRPEGWGWYALEVSPTDLGAGRALEVVVRREGRDGPPARLCGGRDDPARPGAGGSARWLNGRWTADDLSDYPLPPLNGRPLPGRYYIELRFFDAAGHPSVAIWY